MRLPVLLPATPFASTADIIFHDLLLGEAAVKLACLPADVGKSQGQLEMCLILPQCHSQLGDKIEKLLKVGAT